MEKVLQELLWAHFYGRPYCSNSQSTSGCGTDSMSFFISYILINN